VAVRALGQIRSLEALGRLLGFLESERKELRFAAVEALGALRAHAGAGALTGVLRDPDRNLRRAAAEALGQIADPQSVPPLLLALEDEHWSVRCGAATALGRIGSAKALPALLLRLEDEDATVRRAALAALGELRDPRAARSLLRALGDPGLQATAYEALRLLGPEALGELEKAFAAAGAEVRKLLVDLAGRLDDPISNRVLLAALADEDARVRAEAALALGDGERRFGLRALMDLKVKDPSPEVRKAAVQALQKLAPR
jgi:HEAT repeat protein